MTEDQKKKVACFRFGVIHDLLGSADLERGEQERLLEQKCARKWTIPYSGKTRISRSTILRWMRVYNKSNGKIESMYPEDRSDRGVSRAMDEETVLMLIGLRKSHPKASVSSLVAKMYERRPEVELNESTVYRLLRSRGLMKDKEPAKEDCRKFEAELPNDIWHYAASRIMPGEANSPGVPSRKTGN